MHNVLHNIYLAVYTLVLLLHVCTLILIDIDIDIHPIWCIKCMCEGGKIIKAFHLCWKIN